MTGRCAVAGERWAVPDFLKKTSEPFEECSVDIQTRYLKHLKPHRRYRKKYTIVGGRHLHLMYILTNKLIGCLPSVIIFFVSKGAQF
jgi:hypothetical protein